jgi:threonine dehydrogenase-like Zn-dependent dehydrogenase
MGVESVVKQAAEICQNNNESRVNSYAEQLSNRYNTVKTAVQELTVKISENIKDHVTYQDACKQVSDWLVSATENLEACEDVSGEKAALLEHLETVTVSLCIYKMFGN